MGYSEYLIDMLKPMGAYDLAGGFGKAELDVLGAAFDGVNEETAEVERDCIIHTADDRGLSLFEHLLPMVHLYSDMEKRRASIAALIIADDLSNTKAALESQLEACGIPCVITETDEKYKVHVHFLFGRGEPDKVDMDVALEILPAHIEAEFSRDSATWNLLEGRFSTWNAFDTCGLNALEIQKLE